MHILWYALFCFPEQASIAESTEGSAMENLHQMLVSCAGFGNRAPTAGQLYVRLSIKAPAVGKLLAGFSNRAPAAWLCSMQSSAVDTRAAGEL